MSLDKLNKLVNAANKSIDDNYKLSTTVLTNKLARALKEDPQDKTLGSLYVIMDKMSERSDLIRRADFRQLYNNAYSTGTVAGEVFAEELGVEAFHPHITYQEHYEAPATIESSIDQILVNALSSALDNTIPLKTYANNVAERAMKKVALALEVWNLNPSHITVASGNENFIVVQADYETPKGITSFYVPIKVGKDDVYDAEVFMGNNGPTDLNNLNIKAYLQENAGSYLKLNGQLVLNALSGTVSNAELALARFNSSAYSKSNCFESTGIGNKLASAVADELDQELSEFSSFEEKFNSPQGIAEYKFGDNTLKIARNHIHRELSAMGYKSPQVRVAKSDDTSITYAVSLNGGRLAFSVPVKFENGTMLKPTVIMCGGSVRSFDNDGLLDLLSEGKTDNKLSAVSSAMSRMRPVEVIENLRAALAEENYLKAEDALNVLANSNDRTAYSSAFSIYMEALAGKDEVEEQKCSHPIKSKVSEHLVCSHTGLPVNKVYQDKDGNCRPLFRRGISETQHDTLFMNAKILG